MREVPSTISENALPLPRRSALKIVGAGFLAALANGCSSTIRNILRLSDSERAETADEIVAKYEKVQKELMERTVHARALIDKVTRALEANQWEITYKIIDIVVQEFEKIFPDAHIDFLSDARSKELSVIAEYESGSERFLLFHMHDRREDKWHGFQGDAGKIVMRYSYAEIKDSAELELATNAEQLNEVSEEIVTGGKDGKAQTTMMRIKLHGQKEGQINRANYTRDVSFEAVDTTGTGNGLPEDWVLAKKTYETLEWGTPAMNHRVEVQRRDDDQITGVQYEVEEVVRRERFP